MTDRSEPGLFSPFLARPAATLALWALPALGIAGITAAVGAAPGLGVVGPTPEAAVGVLFGLIGQLFAELFLIVLFAAPAGLLARGRPLGDAARALARPAVLGVALAMGVLLTLALLLTMLPGLLASYLNPLMGLIFLAVGTVAGAAAAMALFARWMFAPAFAAEGLGAGAALDASRAQARAQGNFGLAMGLAVLFAFASALSAAMGVAGAGLMPSAPAAGRTLASAPALLVGLAAINAAIAGRHLAGAPGAAGGERAAPTLRLRSRASRCPRCGALAQVPAVLPGEAACPGCGLRATVR